MPTPATLEGIAAALDELLAAKNAAAAIAASAPAPQPGVIAGMRTEGPGASAPTQFSNDPLVAELQSQMQEKSREYQAAYSELAQLQANFPGGSPKQEELAQLIEQLRIEVNDLSGRIQRAQQMGSV